LQVTLNISLGVYPYPLHKMIKTSYHPYILTLSANHSSKISDEIIQLEVNTHKDPRSKLTGYSEEKLDLKIPLTPFSKGGTSIVTP